MLIDFGSAGSAASARTQAIDRAELLASLAALVGADTAVAVGSPCARSRRPRRGDALPAAARAVGRHPPGRSPESTLRDLRTRVAEVTARDAGAARAAGPGPPADALHDRHADRRVLHPAAATGERRRQRRGVALGQLALARRRRRDVGAHVRRPARSGSAAATRQRLPLGPTTQVALASSFVNRVTPANVGGMALNVRYMQKAGVPPAEAVTGVGLNVLAGGIVHVVLLAVFLSLGRAAGRVGVPHPEQQQAARRRRRGPRARRHRRWRPVAGGRSPSRRSCRRSASRSPASPRSPGLPAGCRCCSAARPSSRWPTSLRSPSRSPRSTAASRFAQVGAVYLGASLIAAAAPTPGGLGAIEAALVAGLTGVGMDPAIAVAAVLSYRLVTYWLPILPGWLCFRVLERRNYI